MTPCSFLERNLQALKIGNTAIFHWLAAQESGSRNLDSSLFTNRWGLLDWRLPSGKGLFDPIPPGMFYSEWIPREKEDTSATLIVGCNLGYGINHVLSNTPHTHKVLVLEPRQKMLLACLSQTDYRPFFESKKLFFVPPDLAFMHKVVWQLNLQYMFGNIFVRSDIPSRQLGPEYAVWTDQWKETLEDLSVEMNTLGSRQNIMIGNELKNFARAMGDGSLLPLKNQGVELSAVTLGAGPSLEKFAPLLAQDPGHALYTCGLQTLPALRPHGLKPHLCLAIDHTMSMKKVYDRLDMEWAGDIPLIYSCKLAPEVLRAYPGPTLPMWTLGGLGTCMSGDREVVLDTGGNVGVALTRFLTWCGVSQILLVGQDFAWQGEKTHAAGHLGDNNAFHFDSKRHIEMKNRYGETIYSSPAYTTALRNLENDLKRSNVPVFNLYGGGASIKGSKEVTYAQVLQKGLLSSAPGSLEHFVGTLKQARSPRPRPAFEARSLRWASSVHSVQKRLGKLFKKAKKHQEEIHTTLSQILFFLQQDPLYRPYLFKEILSLAGLVRARQSYGLKEKAECKQMLKQVVKKVREMDQYLAYNKRVA
jgi:hypothetical protein